LQSTLTHISNTETQRDSNKYRIRCNNCRTRNKTSWCTTHLMPKSYHCLLLHYYKSCHFPPTGCHLLFCPYILIYSTSWTKRQLSHMRCLTLQSLYSLKVNAETVCSIGWSWVALSGYFPLWCCRQSLSSLFPATSRTWNWETPCLSVWSLELHLF